MAIIHRAQLSPTKLELLTGWLPGRRWYRGPARPTLTRVAGYRFDDPDGEVGIETLLVTAGDNTVYQVPLAYRHAPLDGREDWLIGTTEHSVLGRRWVYDGGGDPAHAAALVAAILAGTGQAEEMLEVDGQLQPRELSMDITTTATDLVAPPAIEIPTPSADNDEITTVVTTPAFLTIIRRPGPAPALPRHFPGLRGTWPGQPDPLVLAFAVRR